MAEITGNDEAEVTDFLKTAFGLPKDLAGDYARIAGFLSVPKMWQTGMKLASEMLCDQYNAEVVLDHGNRLTSAIAASAASLGFAPYAQGVILAGFTSEETFKDYVRKSAFWKDAVSSNHGEHSHSMQWLAIGIAARDAQLSLTNKVASLYAQTVDYKSKQTFLHSGRGKEETIYLWDFLVDCFDFGAQAADYKTNIRTASARSPTFVNKYLYQSNLWIGDYLKRRYDKRGWGDPGTGTSIKEHAIAKAQQRVFKETASNSGGNLVFERPALTKGGTKTDVPAGIRIAKLQVRGAPWGGAGPTTYLVSWKTLANCGVTVGVSGTIPDKCKAPGDYDVKVSLERVGGICRAKIEAVKV